jgi:uncharacterized lipoprotein YddW (UPF0748 family)
VTGSIARRAAALLAAALHVLGPLAAPARAQSTPPRGTPPAPSDSAAASALPTPATLFVEGGADDPPPAQHEFRGVWVASVANIDWPSRPGLTAWDQQLELIQILNRAVELNLNAVILQVRPSADALYQSKYEPWSEYLTGQMGRPPEPLYDPLAFAVREAHARGLELHAWFNPFRARYDARRSPAAATHVSRARPELVRRYGNFLWMDPGDPAVQERTLRVILDVVRRYDVDGVHIDDYFYPYRENDRRGRVLPFPDDRTWRRYRRGGGTLSRADWRRRNVDTFVRRMYAEVKDAKPWVKVGISPFGIWRPGYPPQVRGLDAYEELYADSRKWLANGWLDYFVPQLYWPTWQEAQSYSALLAWWAEQNVKGRHLWAGNYTSRSAGLASPVWGTGELLEQVRLTRAQPGASGNVHFSMAALMPRPLVGAPRPVGLDPATGAPTLADSADSAGGDGSAGALSAASSVGAGALPTLLGEQLRIGPYNAPALVPASPWLSRSRPAAPTATLRPDSSTGGLLLRIAPADARPVRRWVVRAHYRDRWAITLLPGPQREHLFAAPDGAQRPDRVLVSAVDRYGNESESAEAALGTQRSAHSKRAAARAKRRHPGRRASTVQR